MPTWRPSLLVASEALVKRQMPINALILPPDFVVYWFVPPYISAIRPPPPCAPDGTFRKKWPEPIAAVSMVITTAEPSPSQLASSEYGVSRRTGNTRFWAWARNARRSVRQRASAALVDLSTASGLAITAMSCVAHSHRLDTPIIFGWFLSQ